MFDPFPTFDNHQDVKLVLPKGFKCCALLTHPNPPLMSSLCDTSSVATALLLLAQVLSPAHSTLIGLFFVSNLRLHPKRSCGGYSAYSNACKSELKHCMLFSSLVNKLVTGTCRRQGCGINIHYNLMASST